MKPTFTNFWTASHHLNQNGTPFAVVTLVNVRGHAPQEMGAKMIVTEEGLFWGTVGGGKVEAMALERARTTVKKLPELGPPELLTWNLQRDVGMTCGGEVTFLFEVHQRTGGWNIVVFGAGHVGQAVVRTLDTLECQITCVDTRPEWIEKLPTSSKITAVCIPDMREFLHNANPNSYFCVMTRGHATDIEMLEAIFKKFPEARYVGCIGSDVKTLKLRVQLKEAGINSAVVEKLHCPIGLPIGTNDPYEIAISIAAELLQERDK